MLEQYQFQLGLNQVYIVGKEFDEQLEYMNTQSFSEFQMTDFSI